MDIQIVDSSMWNLTTKNHIWPILFQIGLDHMG
jgi:hypothetical protein